MNPYAEYGNGFTLNVSEDNTTIYISSETADLSPDELTWQLDPEDSPETNHKLASDIIAMLILDAEPFETETHAGVVFKINADYADESDYDEPYRAVAYAKEDPEELIVSLGYSADDVYEASISGGTENADA